MIGIKFLLTGGQFLSVAMPIWEATKTVGDFHGGRLRGRISGTNPQLPHISWALEASQIIGVHTFELEQTPPPAGDVTNVVPFPPSRSGL